MTNQATPTYSEAMNYGVPVKMVRTRYPLSMYVPLALRYYKETARYGYPCGCEMSVHWERDVFWYTHYCNPKCEVHRHSIGAIICGHHHVAWDAENGKRNDDFIREP